MKISRFSNGFFARPRRQPCLDSASRAGGMWRAGLDIVDEGGFKDEQLWDARIETLAEKVDAMRILGSCLESWKEMPEL